MLLENPSKVCIIMVKENNMGQWKNGIYKVQNPDKYMLPNKEVHYKSSLEERMCYYLDNNTNVIRWQYEGFNIVYPKPIFEAGRLHHVEEHKYVLDFYAEIKDKDGTVKKYLLEIKSKSATSPPIRPKKLTTKTSQRYLQECALYAVNSNKWMTAKKWCNDHGIIFKMVLDDAIL